MRKLYANYFSITRRYRLLWVVIVSLINLTACAPYPHKETIVPAISMQVLRNGSPVSGAMVYLGSTDSPDNICGGLHFAGKTEKNGSVNIGPVTEWVFFYDFINNTSKGFRYIDVCLRAGSKYVFADRIATSLVKIENFSEICHLEKFYSSGITADQVGYGDIVRLRICETKKW